MLQHTEGRIDDIASRLDALDRSLFVTESETTPNDRTALLRVQKLVRSIGAAPYSYAEIGSHMGGTLGPHLIDPRCGSIVSIDPRPFDVPDERGRSFTYHNNSTARMVEGLKSRLPAGCLDKLRTFDLDASAVPLGELRPAPDLLFIDGEHTTVAAFSDFLSLYPALAPNAVVAFHDAYIVSDAIRNVERFLKHERVPFTTVFLSDCVAVIGLRNMAPVVLEELGPHGLDRDHYLRASREIIWGTIVQEAVRRNEIVPIQEANELWSKFMALRDGTGQAGAYVSWAQKFQAASESPRRLAALPGLSDLALGRPTTQSSVSEWSRASTPEADSAGAVAGRLSGSYAFHTAQEERPWWRVDLGAGAAVHELRIYNRLESVEVARRGVRFAVETAQADGAWTEVHRKDDDHLFGGADGDPYVWRPEALVTARFLRIRLLGTGFLHYDAVEVMGRTTGA